MRHLKKKKLGKGRDHRRKLLRTLATSAILYEKIETSLSNARGVRSYLEKLVTKSKEPSLANRRYLLSKVSTNATKKLLEVYGPMYKDRNGGYLRLTKLVHPSSGSSKVLVEFV